MRKVRDLISESSCAPEFGCKKYNLQGVKTRTCCIHHQAVVHLLFLTRPIFLVHL